MTSHCPNCQHDFEIISTKPNLWRCAFCGVVYVYENNLESLTLIPPLSDVPLRSFVNSNPKFCPQDNELLRYSPDPDHPFLTKLHCQKCKYFLLYPDEIATLLHTHKKKSHQKTSIFLSVFALLLAIGMAGFFLQYTSRNSQASALCEAGELIKSETRMTYTCTTNIAIRFDYASISCGGNLRPKTSESNSSEVHFFDLPPDTCHLLISDPRSDKNVEKIYLNP